MDLSHAGWLPEFADSIYEMCASLSSLTIDEVLGQGLHEFLDLVQRRLIAVTQGLSTAFFTMSEGGVQEQSQATV
jgi:hypothetical protein